jgi:hypothetical protein
MPGVDSELATSILRLWLAAGSAILLILFCVLALFQPQLRLSSGPARRVGFVAVGAVLGAVITWALLDRPGLADHSAERRTLELRSGQLSAQALAPGSPLACLDALAGESVEVACEKLLFASPASVASATSYTAAKLTLLASVAGYVARGGTDADDIAGQLRRSLETDRFGFVGRVLATRDHCTGDDCKTLALLSDSAEVRANLAADKLGRYLDHYVAGWGAPAPEVADASPPAAPHKVVNIDFPTAASIPPVNIMTPEPTGPVLPGAAAAAAANPNGAASSARHGRKQTANSAAAAAPNPTSGAPAVEPIWPEPMPPSTPTTPQAASTPPPAAPTQLAPSNAGSGAAARTQ